MNLRDKIANTVAASKKARQERENDLQATAAELREAAKQRAVTALLKLLSDEAIAHIVEKHAPLSKTNKAVIGIKADTVQLAHGGRQMGPGMAFDLPFESSAIEAAQHFADPQVQKRIVELGDNGVFVDTEYNNPHDTLLVTIDYGSAAQQS